MEMNSSLSEQRIVFVPIPPSVPRSCFLRQKPQIRWSQGENVLSKTKQNLLFHRFPSGLFGFSHSPSAAATGTAPLCDPRGWAQGHPSRRFPEHGAPPIPENAAIAAGHAAPALSHEIRSQRAPSPGTNPSHAAVGSPVSVLKGHACPGGSRPSPAQPSLPSARSPEGTARSFPAPPEPGGVPIAGAGQLRLARQERGARRAASPAFCAPADTGQGGGGSAAPGAASVPGAAPAGTARSSAFSCGSGYAWSLLHFPRVKTASGICF